VLLSACASRAVQEYIQSWRGPYLDCWGYLRTLNPDHLLDAQLVGHPSIGGGIL
jgi:hypothetical protein